MVNIITFVLISYGLTQIIVYGKIFNRIRPTEGRPGQLFGCSMCMGFWVGMLLCYVSEYTSLISFEVSLVTAFLLGFLSSGTSYILDKVVNDDGINIGKVN